MRNFLDSYDYQLFKSRCIKQRYIAARNPCTQLAMVTCEDFEMPPVGPWNLRLVLERYLEPSQWHASISYRKEIGSQTVFDKATGLPMFEAPQDGMVMVGSWSNEELDIARSLLGALMGPLIAAPDQQVTETRAPQFFALHWTTGEADAAKAQATRT